PSRSRACAVDRRNQNLHDDRRHRDRRFDARGIWHLLPQRKRTLGEGHPRDRRKNRLGSSAMDKATQVTGIEHWAQKQTPDGEVRLFLWEKYVDTPEGKPAVLFVHGSSMASQPTFDLTVPGRPDSSVMDWFACRGFVCWSV